MASLPICILRRGWKIVMFCKLIMAFSKLFGHVFKSISVATSFFLLMLSIQLHKVLLFDFFTAPRAFIKVGTVVAVKQQTASHKKKSSSVQGIEFSEAVWTHSLSGLCKPSKAAHFQGVVAYGAFD